MRFALVACALAALALAACGSPPEDALEAGARAGEAQAAGAPGSGAVEASGGALATPVGEAPGSQEDFVVNVGDRVLFGFDQYDLSEQARTIIENQVIWLKRYPAMTVALEGHTDERGTREYNLALGERRAVSVRDYMIALGVAPDRIRTVSYGKERPIDPASTEEAWAHNRRVVTVVEGGTS